MATSSTCAGRAPEHAVGGAELLGDDRAVRRAHRVEERQGDRLASQSGQRDGLAVLVDEVEGGARECRWRSGVPSIACGRIGSALGLVAATAMGTAPTRAIPTAPRAAIERKA